MRALCLCFAFVFAAPALGQNLSEDDIKKLALEAILENPEIVMQAVEILRQREEDAKGSQAQAALAAYRNGLENDPNAPVLGNPDGDVTVVEFFDYNCPYCRKAKPVLEALLAADPNVRLVFREWPILGEGSVFAARAALAAREQDKYEEFHWEMMALNGRADEVSTLRAAEKVGLDLDQLRADLNDPSIDEHFRLSSEMAQALGFSGTPSFVVGEHLIGGLVDAKALIEAVRLERE